VTAPALDGPYLVDVGFGGQTLTSPIRLDVGPVQQTRHEPYRIRERGELCQLESEIRGEWQPLYIFTTRPQPQIDLEVDTAAQVLDALTERFGIDLADLGDRADLEKRVTEVMDA
jgi:arylamine N-acetyltransferase